MNETTDVVVIGGVQLGALSPTMPPLAAPGSCC